MSFRRQHKVQRFNPGQYVNGYWVEGAADEVVISASIQPMKTKEIIDNLPEGKQSGGHYKIYTDDPIFATSEDDGVTGDRLVINGKLHEIVGVEPYGSGVINHYKGFTSEAKDEQE